MVEVRGATCADAPAIGRLLCQLGYQVDVAAASTRLGGLTASKTDRVFVSVGDDGAVQGLIAVHWAHMLLYEAPVARITTLVVDESARGLGHGRMLVKVAVETARATGCGTIELTTAIRRAEAQAFYRSLGFEISSYRMQRALTFVARE